jgi:hypothetical protein
MPKIWVPYIKLDQLCISLGSSGPGHHEDQETDAELPPLAREL